LHGIQEKTSEGFRNFRQKKSGVGDKDVTSVWEKLGSFFTSLTGIIKSLTEFINSTKELVGAIVGLIGVTGGMWVWQKNKIGKLKKDD
jgi:hypothetical protein